MYKTPLKPYAHQREANKRMRDREYFALLMAMRTGKTKVVIDDFGDLEDRAKIKDMLLIAPAGVYKTWAEEFDKHLAASLKARLAIHVWQAGDNSRILKRKREQFLQHQGPRALLIDVEALSSVDRAREISLQFLSSRAPAMTVIDESTIMKNPDSKRSDFINEKIRPISKYRRILSGLPTPNSPFDAFSQFYFLSPDILGWSYVNFKNYYAEIHKVCMVPNNVLIAKLQRAVRNTRMILPGVGTIDISDMPRKIILDELERRKIWIKTIPIIKEYRNEGELHELIKPHSYRVRLSECYDMPEKVYMRREVTLTKEQKRIYNDLKATSIAELESKDFVTATMVIVRLLRLHQVVCGHVRDEEGKLHSIPENRTKELMEQLAEYDGKAIIWCAYDHDIRKVSDAIKEEYGPESIARFWGGNTKTREDEEKQFKKNPKCRFMVATPSAGGRGRTWSMANLMVYYSSTNNLEHRMQSEERGEGVGKLEPMAVVDLIAPDTVEEKIIASLRKKLDLATVIVGDDYKQWLI